MSNISYRLIDRSKAGRNIEVVFSYAPNKRISTGTKKITEAVRFAENALVEMGENAKLMPLFSEYAKDFFTRVDEESLHFRDISFKREKRSQWYIEQQKLLDLYVMPSFQDLPLDTITTLLIEKWMISLKGTKKEELAGNTKYKALNCLKMILDDARRNLYITSNPAELVTLPNQKPVQERRPLSLYEQKTLFPGTADGRINVWLDIIYAGYFSVMYDTGFRPAEVAALKVEDVYKTSDNTMGVYTTHTISFETMEYQERVKTSGKGMENRVGLLTSVTAEIIERIIDTKRLEATDFLFQRIGSRNEWIIPDVANKKLRCTCKRLGLNDDISQYCLRHTYATYRRGNLDEMTLALSMGHSGGKVRDDYDHRTAQILLAQLEKNREKIFEEEQPDESIAPLKRTTS